MIKIVGKKEIKEALDNYEFTQLKYNALKIDSIIRRYHKLINNTFLEQAMVESKDFKYITDAYDYIDEIMYKKGYRNTSMIIYTKINK